MAVQEPRTAQAVAYITLRMGAQEGSIPVFLSDEFHIGRELVRYLLGTEDCSVSTHHLRIHCVHYEEEKCRVDPLVYMCVLSNNAVVLRRSGFDHPHESFNITKNFGDVLLSIGDRVQLTNQISFDFTPVMETNPPPLDKLRIAEIKRFSKQYRLTNRLLGIGGHAAVYVAVKTSTGQQFACKIVSLRNRVEDVGSAGLRLTQDHVDLDLKKKREREYIVLKRLSHPNIITLEKVFLTSHNIYIFQELITGGDLLSYLDKSGPLSEPQAAVIVRQLLEAVKYLHANQIVHRDIKPENILMTSWCDGARAVLTDFGQSRTIPDLEDTAKDAGVLRMQSLVGTYGYTAPEVYRTVKKTLQNGSGYSQAIDIWSLGCVTATLLTNDFIFPDGKDAWIGNTTMSQYATYLQVLDSGSVWAHVGQRAKSFIRSCLAVDEYDRLTASECLELPWFTHPRYQAELDALYARSIKDWKAKQYDDKIIENLDNIDDSDGKSILAQDDAPEEEILSYHFPAGHSTVLRQAPTAATEIQSMLGRFRVNIDSATTIAAKQTPQAESFNDDFSPIPGPPPFPSSILMSRARAMQQQFAPSDPMKTQILPPPPISSEFDNLTQQLELGQQKAVHR